MKNKKFALQLSLEDNEELMAEIDNLLRERVKMIVREEAENLLGGSIREEANRVAKTKIDSMEGYELNSAISDAVRREIRSNVDIKAEVLKEFKRWLNDKSNFFLSQTIRDMVERYVNSRLALTVQPDVIKAVCDALMKKE